MSDEKVTVQVMEVQPWVDRSQPKPKAKPLEKLELPMTAGQLKKKWSETKMAIRKLTNRKVRSISHAAPGQGFDVVMYVDSGGPVQRIRRRPTHRVGVHGGPLGRNS